MTAHSQQPAFGAIEVGTEEVFVSAPVGQFFGSGFNSIKANPFTGGHALIPNPKTAVAMPAAGQQTTYSLKYSERTRELITSFDGSASASYGPFADASINVFREANLNSYCVSAVADITVLVNAETIVPNARLLSPQALGRLQQGSQAAFTDAYGNAYIQSATWGGRLFALLTVRTESNEERKRVAGELEAKMGVFGAAAKFESKTSSALKNRNVEVRGFQFGGSQLGTFALTLEEFMKRANGFAEQVKKAPVVLTMRMAPYVTCENYPVLTNDLPDFGQATWVARRLAIYQNHSGFALNDVLFARQHSGMFSNYSDARANLFQTDITAKQLRAGVLEQQIRDNPSLRPPDLDDFVSHSPPSLEEMFGPMLSRDIEVPFKWDITGSQHPGHRWTRLAGGDDNVNSKDDRKTGILVRSSISVSKGRAIMTGEFKVTERAPDHTTLGGKVEQVLKLPEPYSDWKVKEIVSINDLSFVRDYRKKAHGFLDLSKDAAVKESYWNSLRVRYDTDEGNDSRAIGFKGEGTVVLRVVPK